MDKKYEEIINQGKKDGKKLSEINAELKAAGATFHLDYTMCEDGPVTGWSEKEMNEGFIPNEGETPNAVHLHDLMKRNVNMAGKSGEYWTAEGKYEITWNENGNPVKAIRKN